MDMHVTPLENEFMHALQVYSKICLKWPLKKKTKNWFSRLIITECRSKVVQNAPREHESILQ